MTNALIIDDEPLACDLIEEYLRNYPGIRVAGRCHDGFEGMKAIQEHRPGLIFLDVQMPRISGFELLELLEDPPAVIFTTAFDEYALKAFETNAIDYLLKPFSQERFDKAMEKYLARKEDGKHSLPALLREVAPRQDPNRIVIKDGSRIRILPLKDIYRLEADDDYVKIITAQGNFMKKQTLQHYEDTLSPHTFIRVHRSYLLNISQLLRIEAYEKNNHLALLKDGGKIPVSRNGYQKLKRQLNI